MHFDIRARHRGCAASRRIRGISHVILFLVPGFLLLATMSGCGPNNHHTIASSGGEEEGARLDAAPDDVRIAALTREIQNLSPRVDRREAAAAAQRAIV